MAKFNVEKLKKKLDNAVIDYNDEKFFSRVVNDVSLIIDTYGSVKNRLINNLLVNMHVYPENFVLYFSNLCDYIKSNDIKNTDWLYNAELLTYKFNQSIEYCEKYVSNLKKKKATNKSGFVERHGKLIGEKKFKEFQKSSVKWIHEYRKKYGSDALIEKYKKSSMWCTEYYINKGYSEQDAEEMVSQFQINNAGVSRQYYINQEYTESEIDKIMQTINQSKSLKKEDYIKKYGIDSWEERVYGYRKGNALECYKERFSDWESKWESRKLLFISNGKDFYRKKYGDNWKSEYKLRMTKFSLSHNSLKLLDYYTVTSFMKEVDKHTQLSIINHNEKISQFNKYKTSGYHLDHVYSKKQGFLDGIDPAIIGHYTNLAVVDSSYNMSKGAKCDKTKEKLLEDYKHGEKIDYENIQNRSD